MTRSIVLAGRCCLALTVACAGAVRLPACQNAPAQSNGTAAAKAGGLPETIRLVRQGQPGDRYTLQSNSRYSVLIRLEKEGKIDETSSEQIETKTGARRVREVTPEGNLKVEERTIEGKRTAIKNGERDVTPLQPQGWLETYLPDGKRSNRVALPDPKVSDQNANGEQQGPAAETDEGLMTDPYFPAKALRVGETWNGVIPMLPKDITEDSVVAYTAKLVAIELHQGAPCARVEYTLSATSKQMPPLLGKMMSELAKGEGTMKVEGTITEYYTLDRGVAIDRADKLTITMKFTTSEPNPDTDELDIHRVIRATIKSVGSEKATRFPAYAPALVPSASAGK